MNPKEKAIELVDKFTFNCRECDNAKQCALIAIENEYNSLRYLLFNLRACGVIKNPSVYLKRLNRLIEEEKQVKTELTNL